MHGIYFVNDIQMAFLVDCLVESGCKLLHRVDQDLLALAIHLEALGEALRLTLNHSLACQDHEALDLVSIHVNFTGRLIVSLKDVLILLVDSFAAACQHILDCLDRVTTHSFELLTLHLVLRSCKLSLSFDLVHLGHDFPAESLVELSRQSFQSNLINWNRIP